MNLSLSFLLGLFASALVGELIEWLPGEAKPTHVVLGSSFLLLPWLWMRIAMALDASAAARVTSGKSKGHRHRVAATLKSTAHLSVPIAIFGFFGTGGYLDYLERISGGIHTTWAALFLAPLLLLEACLSWMRRRASVREDANEPISSGLGATWRMNLVTTAALLFISLAMDALDSVPSIAVFVFATTIGSTIGLLALVGLASWLLPLLFRWIFPTSRTLPAHLGPELHAIAERLGFNHRNVLSLDTGLRSVNAAMVGPFRWPRYLVLTDGLLGCLDLTSLRAVVAHEVAHARAGHPGWIALTVTVVPILLYQPLRQLHLDTIPPHWLLLFGAVMAIVALFAVRGLMHRFEYEADDLSAEALGAPTCALALARIGEIFPGSNYRSSFRHPSDNDRIQAMLDHHAHPRLRNRFVRRGRWLRASLSLGLIPILAWSVSAHIASHPFDRATLAFAHADYQGTIDWLDREVSVGIMDNDAHAELRDRAAVALELATELQDPRASLTAIADSAFERAIQKSAVSRPGAALAEFAIAATSLLDRDVRESALMWARADREDQIARRDRLARHLLLLEGTPSTLESIARASLSDTR